MSEDLRYSRRSVLATLGLASVGALAGCSGSDSPGTTSGTQEQPTTTQGPPAETGVPDIGTSALYGGPSRLGYYPTYTVPNPPETSWNKEDHNLTSAYPTATPAVGPRGNIISVTDRGTGVSISNGGAEAWNITLGGSTTTFTTGPTVLGDQLLVTSNGGDIFHLQSLDGQTINQQTLTGELAGEPLYLNGRYLVPVNQGGTRGRIFYYNVESQSGSTIELDISAPLSGGPAADVEAGAVFFPVADGRIIRLDLDGLEVAWESDLGTDSYRDTLTVHDGQVFGVDGGALVAADADTGEELYTQSINNGSPRAGVGIDPEDGHLYTVRSDGVLEQRTVAEGVVRWEAPVSGSGLRSPVMTSDRLMVPTYQGLSVVDIGTQTTLYTYASGEPVTGGVLPLPNGYVLATWGGDGTGGNLVRLSE
jgi:hypothetical protein